MSSRIKVVVTLLAALLAARAALPYVVAYAVERSLNGIEGYHATLDDVDLGLWRGAYVLEGLDIERDGADGARRPFFQLDRLDLSVLWSAIFDGELVAEIVVTRPVLDFQRHDSGEPSQSGADVDWAEQVRELSPLRLDRLVVTDGSVRFLDTTTDPPFDVWLGDLDVEVRDLTNRPGKSDAASTLALTAKTVGDGSIDVRATVEPLADRPTFDVDAKLLDFDLTQWNDLWRAHGDFDFERGRANVYVELRSRDGDVTGYVKPMFTRLDVLEWDAEEQSDDVLDKFWEGIVGAGGELLENQPKDRLAVRVPIEGELTSPEVDPWIAAATLLRNAFIRALVPGLEHTIGPPLLDRGEPLRDDR